MALTFCPLFSRVPWQGTGCALFYEGILRDRSDDLEGMSAGKTERVNFFCCGYGSVFFCVKSAGAEVSQTHCSTKESHGISAFYLFPIHF